MYFLVALASRIYFLINARERHVKIMHFRTNRALEIIKFSRLIVLSTSTIEEQIEIKHYSM